MPEREYSPEVNGHIWRSCRNISGQLRCGLLFSAGIGIEQWAARIIDILRIELLSHEPCIVIHSAYALPSNAPRQAPGALFRWLNQRHAADSPFNRVDVPLPQVEAPLQQIRARIAAANLDMLLWLESRPLDFDCSGLARLGVWSFSFGDPWRELLQESPVSTLALVQNLGGSDVRCLTLCHLPAEQSFSIHGNAAQPLALAGPALLRRLLDILDPEAALKTAPVKPQSRLLPPPGNVETGVWASKRALRALSRRMNRRREPDRSEPGWFIALRTNREQFRANQARFDPHGFHEIAAPPGSQLADPFLAEDDGRHWLFVEEIPPGTSKGRLSVLELSSSGVPSGKPVPVLEMPYHLSYPFVLRHGSDFFMLPETNANNTVELYRATRFPFEWKLEKVLFDNVRAADTTPFLLDGIWYFFTTSARLGQETFLFWSPTLDGEWHYHPCNPICSDARRARGAGPLFYSGADLIRPAQDCSVRYGYAIALNRVLKISPRDYEEELIEVIYPNWREGLLGTHTLCSNSAFEVIDGLRGY